MKPVSRYDKLGFKQPLKKAWLNYALMLTMQNDPAFREKLSEFVKADDTADGERADGSVQYTMALLSAWLKPDPDLIPFRDQLLAQAEQIPQNQWDALHWALLSASYPFFLAVTTVTGRLLALQELVTKTQIFARLAETYGKREVIERNMRYVVQTMMNLGLLTKTDKKGVYGPPDRLTIEAPQTALLLWKAVVHATRGNRMPVSALRNAPAFYAFALPDIIPEIHCKIFPDLEYIRFNQNDELLTLKNTWNPI